MCLLCLTAVKQSVAAFSDEATHWRHAHQQASLDAASVLTMSVRMIAVTNCKYAADIDHVDTQT